MKKRWPLVVARAFALLLQAGVLVGVYVLHTYAETKMMVMRYLFALNVKLEMFWFSPDAIVVQVGAFLLLAIGAALAGLVLLRRRAWFAGGEALVGGVLAGSGAWFATSVTTDDVVALYAVLSAIWIALIVQAIVTVVAARIAMRPPRDHDAVSAGVSP